jgi:hypothetical protein
MGLDKPTSRGGPARSKVKSNWPKAADKKLWENVKDALDKQPIYTIMGERKQHALWEV